MAARLSEALGSDLDEATQVADKLDRKDATRAVEARAILELAGDPDSEGHEERRAAAPGSPSTG